MSTKERFIYYLKTKGIGQTSFEVDAGLSRGSISQKTGFTASSLEKIASACPELNFDWLIRGEGEMTRSSNFNHVGDIKNSTAVVNYGDGNEIANNRTSPTEELLQLQREYLDMLKKKDEQIDRLTGVIEKLMGKL